MTLTERLRTNPTKFDLTICILTLINRQEQFKQLYEEIRRQSRNDSVQILGLLDNKSMTVGSKRNSILSLAQGRYVTFIDDDDMISPDYIKDVLEAIKSDTDVICFKVKKLINGIYNRTHVYRLNSGPIHRNPRNRKEEFHSPDHLCVWKRSVIKEGFPDKSLAEDHVWADRMEKHTKTIFNIDKELYIYNYNEQGSETHRR